MASKREEERNEKIIRGLMKLPPNRRCINCNSLGPQYVCTNFRTFVCMICSGIHREFTHRVKSVSMSKFTSQEVEALQNGGNQRAREIFLKDCDLQRQRLPNSSNVDKVREFIKAVYVDRKYAGGNTSDKASRDTQSESNIGDETRRASSYHSYSQSPPYDFQYEDRLKRKQGGPLARKPGSGPFERKAASFAFRPGQFSDYEDRFANEGCSSRVSDYSISSGSDPFRSGPQSPNLQKDEGFPSPNVDFSREIIDVVRRHAASMHPEAYDKRDADRVPLPRPERTVSTGSFGSFDSNSVSHQSVSSGSLFEAHVESNQSAATTQNRAPTFTSFSRRSAENSSALNFFEDPLGTAASNAAPGIDLFQAPTGSVLPVDLFQTPAESSALPQNTPQTSLSSTSSYFNEMSQKSSQPPPVPSVIRNSLEPSDPSNEGWATFDLPQRKASINNVHDAAVSKAHAEAAISFSSSNSVSSSAAEMQWPDFQSSVAHGPTLSVSHLWDGGVQNFNIPVNKPGNQQSWKAFEDDDDQHQFVEFPQGTDLQVSQDTTSSTTAQYFGHKISEVSSPDGLQKVPSGEQGLFPTLWPYVATETSSSQPIVPFMSETAHIPQKSRNPFDVNPELESTNAFLDMSSLQVALPSVPFPSPYAGGMNESWFPSSPVASPDGMLYMTAPPSSSQLPNVPTLGPVASIGGNPFA